MIIGIGVDVVECARIRQAMERHGDKFLIRVCTAAEREYCAGMSDPVPHVAARFAAKEAARKALAHTPPLSWQDVEVVRSPEGPVSLRFSGEALRFVKQFGVLHSHLSLAHERSVAVATVILEK